MKAEERHELKENDLASWLQVGVWAFLKKNGSYILLVVALCFLGFQLWRLYEQRQENERIAAWSELRAASYSDNPPAEWLNVIEKHPIKPVQAEAYLDLAGFYSRLILDPAAMNGKKLTRDECLTKARGYYQNALDTLGADTLIAGKSYLGLASVLEDQGEWDKAKAEYQIIADAKGPFAGTPYVDLAAARIATLDQRRNAPRLVSMIPPPAPVKPEPSLLGPSPSTPFPGILGSDFNPVGPSMPVTTAPSSLLPSPVGPFITPPSPIPTGTAPAIELPTPAATAPK